MRPSFHPRLINEPFSDPGLFIPFLFEKRALLFDLGDLGGLSPRDLLKVSDAFVTHTHMDHFIGFDNLIRMFLGREKHLRLFGPPNFFEQVEGKLAGYTWNLVNEYEHEFTVEVNEVREDRIRKRTYCCRNGFRPKSAEETRPFSGVLMKEPAFSVHGELLDHRIPCLGLSLVENFYVNIIKEGLRELGLPVGPWLTRFKEAVYRGDDPEIPFQVALEEKGKPTREKTFALGDLAEKIGKISPGQKITYITDAAASLENRRKIVELAKDADFLFIEAAFLDEDSTAAREKYHLTARDAGELAKEAGAKHIQLFHFSPRYRHCADKLQREAMEAFGG